MTITTESKRGVLALMMAHCAGMIDLVTLAVWVGTLVGAFHFDPQQAGGLCTLYLIGACIASAFFAPRFPRFIPKWMAVAGFGACAVAFLLCAHTASFPLLALLHFIGGVCAGSALSFTHGTIGTSKNPHRLFALVGLAIGVFSIVFLGATPGIVAKVGGQALFYAFCIVMALAFVLALAFYPQSGNTREVQVAAPGKKLPPLGPAVWFAIVAVAIMCMVQAMTLSFYQTIAMDRGFSVQQFQVAMIIYGIVTVFPAPLAGVLEKKLPATLVISIFPVFQAVFAMIVSHTGNYPLFVMAGSMMAFTILFVHTYAFGYIAKLDPTGRAVAATPAMLMVGSAIAPFLGGSLVKFIGDEAIGYMACALVVVELLFYNSSRKFARKQLDVQAVPTAA